jgi:hypothetical protein
MAVPLDWRFSISIGMPQYGFAPLDFIPAHPSPSALSLRTLHSTSGTSPFLVAHLFSSDSILLPFKLQFDSPQANIKIPTF